MTIPQSVKPLDPAAKTQLGEIKFRGATRQLDLLSTSSWSVSLTAFEIWLGETGKCGTPKVEGKLPSLFKI